jgi:hypothetical protein
LLNFRWLRISVDEFFLVSAIPDLETLCFLFVPVWTDFKTLMLLFHSLWNIAVRWQASS